MELLSLRDLGHGARVGVERVSFKLKPPMVMNAISSLSTRLAAALCVALFLAGNLGLAQPASKPAAQRSSPYLLEIEGGWLLQSTGDKREATLENVVELLRELELSRSGAPANIVLSPDLPKIKIANLKLAATTLTQELEALRVASGERFAWSTGVGPQSIDPATGLPIHNAPTIPGAEMQNQTPLYILRPAPDAGRGPLLVEAFSLAGYFESRRKSDNEDAYQVMVDQEIKQIEQIVTETAEIYAALRRELKGESARASTPNLRFHRGANLLVVIGEPEAVEVAAKVIGALPGVKHSGSPAGIPGLPGMGFDPAQGTGGPRPATGSLSPPVGSPARR